MADAANSPRHAAARALEWAALALLAVVVGVRPLVQEEPSYELLSFDRALEGVGSYGPFFSACMTAAILLAAVLVGAALLLDRRRWRWLGIEAGLALVLVGAIISCAFAGDKRQAISESANWLALPVMAMLILQLATTRRRAALLLSVLLASGVVFAVKCWNQHRYEFTDTIKMYEGIRERFWADQGISLEDPRVVLYERRLHGQEAFGYSAHCNVAGGLLVGAVFAALGLAALLLNTARLALQRLLAAIVAAMAVGIASAVWLTGSVGALAAGAIGAAFLLVAFAFRQSIARRPRAWTAGLGAGVALAAVGVLGYGVSQGRLPGDSLRFRWGYWTNTARMIADHPWTGVGAGNFANHYLKYKTIHDPEEVRDPHNFYVLAPAQWGVLGGVGVLVMVVGGALALSRPAVRAEAAPKQSTHNKSDDDKPDWFRAGGETVVIAGALGIAIFLCRTVLGGPTDPQQQAVETNVPRALWIMACVIGWLGFVVRQDAQSPAERLSRLCLSAGAFAMLVHAGVEFTLSQMGAATVFFVIVGVLGAMAAPAVVQTADRVTAPRGWPAVLLSGVGFVAVVALVLMPAQRMGAALSEARALAAQPASFNAIRQAYADAVAADPLDAVAPAEFAQWLASVGRRDSEVDVPVIREALVQADVAQQRNPNHLSLLRLDADLRRILLQSDAASADTPKLLETARKIVTLYPESPRNLAYSADLLVAVAGTQATPAPLLTEALAQIEHALELDAQRDAAEIRRFTESEREQIEANRRAVAAQLDGT